MNKDLHQTDLNKVDYLLFLKVVELISSAPIVRRASLGYSSTEYLLFGVYVPGQRQSVVSVRNHSGMYSMLITTNGGRFLFNGGFSMSLPKKKAAEGLHAAFDLVKKSIMNV